MFTKVLVANRGEIACRVMRTCSRLGIKSVAVYSDADRDAKHRKLADEAIHIGPAAAVHSYLDMDRILEAAKLSGAQAIHPGYGFLAENATFARRCAEAGLVFIGPPADAIDAMGSKSEAKRIMEAAGVPCVPGYHGDDQGDDALTSAAAKIGFPLLVKPTAGGGGKGMRIVRDADSLAAALAGSRREAKAAFGDDRVLLERFVESPRHIEVQVFGDTHGNYVYLFERECSLQRRYQKIIEEAPSPFVDEGLRAKMGEAAVAAARAVGYCNAGTVEFIVAPDGSFHFMEMNTRLQVEHPVTELITGQDLVEWQLQVAAGEPLPLQQAEIPRQGHAFEARIYAEDPDHEFLPSSGRIRRFLHPEDNGVRIDTGVGDGALIPPDYDPMIAKLCVHAADRAAAMEALQDALAQTLVSGLTTNLPFLRALAAHEDFASGAVDTGWVERNIDALLAWPGPPTTGALQTASGGVAAQWFVRKLMSRPHDPGSPWLDVDASDMTFAHRGETVTTPSDDDDDAGTELAAIDGDTVVVTHDDGRTWTLVYQPPFAPTRGVRDDEAHPGAPMPGRIVAVLCKEGQRVAPGDALLVLEAMKMEYTLQARAKGVVERILYGVGDMVDAEVPLVDIRTENA